VFIGNCNFIKAETKLPSPTSLKYINDYVGVIDNTTAEYLISVGKELEDKTTAQATVVIINSLEGRDIESYANELFRTWGIGIKDKDNGLLLLLSIKDRSWRVEIGRGLEGAITDIYSARVMDEIAKPSFSRGNYNEGIKNAYSIFSDNIAKEYNVTLEKNIKIALPANKNQQSTNGANILGSFIILGLIIFDFLFNRGRLTRTILTLIFLNSRGRRGGGNSGGGYGGFGGGSSGGGGASGKW
jgi:uncharacterized protein